MLWVGISFFKILLAGDFFTNPFEKYGLVKLDRISPGKRLKMVKIKKSWNQHLDFQHLLKTICTPKRIYRKKIWKFRPDGACVRNTVDTVTSKPLLSNPLPSRKLIRQQKMDLAKMYFLLKNGKMCKAAMLENTGGGISSKNDGINGCPTFFSHRHWLRWPWIDLGFDVARPQVVSAKKITSRERPPKK